jgi:hypothetical protein
MNKVAQKVICILTVLVIMTSTVLGTVNASVFHPHGNFSKNGIDDLPWAKFKNIADNYADDLGKLGKKELNYLKELSDHAGKLDNAILKNLELPAGFKPTDLPKHHLDNVIESAKYEKIDIEQIRKTYGEGILEDSDDILFAVNNPCAILGRGYNIFPIVYASECKLPVDEWDGVKLKRGNVAENKVDLIREIRLNTPDLTFDSLNKLEYNHRIPVSIAKQYPEAVSSYLKDVGIDDLNKFGDLMNHADNVKHYWSWKDALSGQENITKDTIAQIIENIEIKGINRGIDYINNVYR